MIQDFRHAGVAGFAPDSIVIVGAGAAGIALAFALADAGESVIVLESGGESHDRAAETETAVLNEAVQTGLALDGVQNGRARMVGGTTALWHGQCMRLHDIDLERRPWVPHSGWPLAPAELVRHYVGAEKFLDVSGKGYDAGRWLDHTSLQPVDWNARHLLHDFTEYTPRPHLGQMHRQRLATHRSIRLIHHATVARLVVEEGRISGIEMAAIGHPAQVVHARCVVLAAGAIENARILMLSDPAGIGLGDGRVHTGRYYQDHPIIRTARIFADDHRVLQDRYIALHRRGRRLFPKVRLAPAAQRQHGLLDATAVFVHEHDDPARDALRRLIAAARYRRRPDHPLRDALKALAAPVPALRDLYRQHAKGLATARLPASVWLQLWVEQQPDPQSRVTLDEKRDRLGLPQARLHWRCSDLELETSRRLTRWIAQDFARLRLGRIEELPVMADDSAWREQVGDAAHPAGTTRMAEDAAQGVVDANLKVHGLGGVYVLGSSVFPVCGYANPTLSIVALAYRLAEHLMQSPRCEQVGPMVGVRAHDDAPVALPNLMPSSVLRSRPLPPARRG